MAETIGLETTMRAVEQACAAIQMHINPATAEATLLAFRHSSQPYKACQYILEHSQVAAACFQAAATIQEAAIREWGFLSKNDKNGLQMYCLHYIIAHVDAREGYVQAKVSSVAAILMKRSWLEFGEAEKEAFFNQLKNAVQGSYGLPSQHAGIAFLESLVSEFSPSTASSMGLPAEFHEKCCADLELHYLQQFYKWTLDATYAMAQKAVQGIGMEVEVCAAGLHLMSQILHWDFRGNSVLRAGGVSIGKNRLASTAGHEVANKKSNEQHLVQPGPAWHDLLLSPNHVNWLLGFYATLRQFSTGSGNWLESSLAVSCRQLIVQLCCLTGQIFPLDNGRTQEEHLQRMLSGIMAWITPADTVVLNIKSGKSESELIDGCRVLFSVASLTCPTAFDQLLKGHSSTLSLLSSLTCQVLKANLEDNDEATWSQEALTILLDTWTIFLEPQDLSKKAPLSRLGLSAAAAVFNTIVETELKAAAKSAYDEVDPPGQLQASIAERDDQLSSFALIARAAPLESIPLLANLFSERCSSLHQARGIIADRICILEELHWLILISGHVLADSNDGETPLVPQTIQVQLSDIDIDNHPVLFLSRSIIDFAAQSLEPTFQKEIFSPRLMEALIWFLARWSGTYLMPHDNPVRAHETGSGRKTFMDVIGDENNGIFLLGTFVRIAIMALTAWPGEQDLQEITCFELLHALVQRRYICVHLVKLDPWKEFAHAFANESSLLSLPPRLQRSLSQSLCRSASGLSSSDATNQYVRDLMGPITRYLIDTTAKSDLNVFAQKPDVIFMVTCMLERLRGTATATEPQSQKAIFEIGAAVMNSLLTLLRIYKNEPMVVYILLKFVVNWVDGQVVFLEAKDTTILFNFCVQLLQIYSEHNIGKVSLSTSRNLLCETEIEKYKDLRALLQLLGCLCSKDLVDFSSDSQGEAGIPDVAQVVYLGLHIITPLISFELLKYPKLCNEYFALLVHMLEVYPQKVANLTPDAFAQIIGSLDYGLHYQDTEVVRMTLIAINAIAFYQYQAICKGKEGLRIHAVSTRNPNGVIQEGVLAHFLRSLLHFLLFEDYSNDLVGPSADALLSLVMCDTAFFQKIVQELSAGQQNVIFQSRLSVAFQSLINSSNPTSLNRGNRERFRKNVHHFLSDVRGFLRTV